MCQSLQAPTFCGRMRSGLGQSGSSLSVTSDVMAGHILVDRSWSHPLGKNLPPADFHSSFHQLVMSTGWVSEACVMVYNCMENETHSCVADILHVGLYSSTFIIITKIYWLERYCHKYAAWTLQIVWHINIHLRWSNSLFIHYNVHQQPNNRIQSYRPIDNI